MMWKLYRNIGTEIAHRLNELLNSDKDKPRYYAIFENRDRVLDKSRVSNLIEISAGKEAEISYAVPFDASDDPLVRDEEKIFVRYDGSILVLALSDVLSFHRCSPDGSLSEFAELNGDYYSMVKHIIVDGYLETFYYFFQSQHLYKVFKKRPLAALFAKLSGKIAETKYADYILISDSILTFFDLRANLILHEILGIEKRYKKPSEFITDIPKFLKESETMDRRSDATNVLSEVFFIQRQRLLEFLLLQYFTLLEITPPDNISEFIDTMFLDFKRNFDKFGIDFSRYLKMRLGEERARRGSVQVIITTSSKMNERLILLQQTAYKETGWSNDWKFPARQLKPKEDSERAAVMLLSSELRLSEGEYVLTPLRQLEEIKPSRRTKNIVSYKYYVYLATINNYGAAKLFERIYLAMLRSKKKEIFTLSSLERRHKYNYTWVPVNGVKTNAITVNEAPAYIAENVRYITQNVDIENLPVLGEIVVDPRFAFFGAKGKSFMLASIKRSKGIKYYAYLELVKDATIKDGAQFREDNRDFLFFYPMMNAYLKATSVSGLYYPAHPGTGRFVRSLFRSGRLTPDKKRVKIVPIDVTLIKKIIALNSYEEQFKYKLKAFLDPFLFAVLKNSKELIP